MTRKRYIKLLMAKGQSRNEAAASAEKAVDYCGSYEQALKPLDVRTINIGRKKMMYFNFQYPYQINGSQTGRRKR